MSTVEPIRLLFKNGDRRSLQGVTEVVALIAAWPERISELVLLFFDPDASIRMRSADAAEKISLIQPDWLQPYVSLLLGLMEETAQRDVRWHLAQILPRLSLSPAQVEQTARLLTLYLDDHSSIVKAFALQGLADLSLLQSSLRPGVVELMQTAARTGTPAMRARSRILLAALKRQPHSMSAGASHRKS